MTDQATQTGVQLEYQELLTVLDHLDGKLNELETGKTAKGGKIDTVQDVLAVADDLNNALRNMLPQIAATIRLELKNDSDVRKADPQVQAFLQLAANLGDTKVDAFDQALDTLRGTQGSPNWRKVAFVALIILFVVMIVAFAVLAILQAMGTIHVFTDSQGGTTKFLDSFGVAWDWFKSLADSDEFARIMNEHKLGALKTIATSVRNFTPGIINFANTHLPVLVQGTGQVVVPGVSTGQTPGAFTPDTPVTPPATTPPATPPATPPTDGGTQTQN